MALNGISTLATKELRQKAKLDLAATDRASVGNPRATYDITQLPTQYDDNDVVDNPNSAVGGPGIKKVTYSGYHDEDVAFTDTATVTDTTTANNFIVSSPPENTTVLYTGYLLGTYTGDWTFTLTGDDSSYWWIGANAVSGYTTGNANAFANYNTTGTVTLAITAGTYYPIRLLYGNGPSGGYLNLTYAHTGQTATSDFTGKLFSPSVSLVQGRPWIEQAWTLPAGMDRNEPYNGSGGSNPTVPGADYKTAATRGVPVYSGSGITFNDLSASALDSIPNEASGLYRRKYVGKLLSTYGAWTEYLSTWFNDPTRGPISEAIYEVDEYVSFGYRSDLGSENGYSLEWKGYLKAPVTGNMRFFVDVDDDIMIWIGAAALAPTKDNYLLAQSGGTRSGTNGITVVAGKYYPVRMAFIEYGGAEQFQIFANSSAGATVYNGQDLDWAYNTATKGY